MHDKKEFKKLVDNSGFLFQIRVAHEVNTTGDKHPWKVEKEEKRWENPNRNEEGFIDLILSSASETSQLNLILECKRVKNGYWLFLSLDSFYEVERAKLFWKSYSARMKYNFYGWSDFNVRPFTKSASFCVVPGQGERDKPMLERVCGLLLRGLECFAKDDRFYLGNQANIYCPVIVTNAKLYVCTLKPSEIDINTGRLPEISSNNLFDQVGVIRFSKDLSTLQKPNKHPFTLFRPIHVSNQNNYTQSLPSNIITSLSSYSRLIAYY
jgi:hypothetical protein